MSPNLIILALSCVGALFTLIKCFSAGSTVGSLIFFILTVGLAYAAYRFLRKWQSETVLPTSVAPPFTPRDDVRGSFSDSSFSNDYRPRTQASPPPVQTASPTPSYAPTQNPNPAPAPYPQPGYPAAPNATPSLVQPQMPAQRGPDSGGVGAALGGIALGGLLGAGLGSATATAHAAAEARRRESEREGATSLSPIDGDTLDRGNTGNSDLGSALAGGAAAGAVTGAASGSLPPIDADDLDSSAGSATGSLPPVDADDAPTRASSSGSLSPIDADDLSATGSTSGSLSPIDADEVEDHRDPDPDPEPEGRYDGGGASLAPISADEAEQRGGWEKPSYEPPSRDPEPPSYDPPLSAWGNDTFDSDQNDNNGGSNDSDWSD